MNLADRLKMLPKVMSLIKAIISIVASQDKGYITETSIAIYDRNDCNNFFHC
ncbi:uncharacterized protein RHIMIDRAFT_284534 [Rhizopus microsporus ATCC 52813]|uniref:Uncharacterized protein n=1 Tax=Rhizopus microsporus ATCC 52813 TaxID=1340429 RepID=A0A2G4SU40_RHIZD|nr:uncharacterized protein RHIMIDRAFT_284534 [Rhizopus microsporus ATCC 52813]PHZ12293.1 hypothetical protein RHIMIDRAFT_284534 [Rhizopus microsporus ATCC 52813]